MKKKLILASSSPRRKAILEKIGLDFEIIPSSFEENIEDLTFEYKKIEELAYQKALCVAKTFEREALVIGADTVVVLENQILGKPKDLKEAEKMLKNLSAKTHFVVTSICIIDSITLKEKICSTTSYVEFENLSEDAIQNYIKEFMPLDKAGSYGIQELPEGFVKTISGSFENIIGLCSDELVKMLKDLDFVKRM